MMISDWRDQEMKVWRWFCRIHFVVRIAEELLLSLNLSHDEQHRTARPWEKTVTRAEQNITLEWEDAIPIGVRHVKEHQHQGRRAIFERAPQWIWHVVHWNWKELTIMGCATEMTLAAMIKCSWCSPGSTVWLICQKNTKYSTIARSTSTFRHDQVDIVQQQQHHQDIKEQTSSLYQHDHFYQQPSLVNRTSDHFIPCQTWVS